MPGEIPLSPPSHSTLYAPPPALAFNITGYPVWSGKGGREGGEGGEEGKGECVVRKTDEAIEAFLLLTYLPLRLV